LLSRECSLETAEEFAVSPQSVASSTKKPPSSSFSPAEDETVSLSMGWRRAMCLFWNPLLRISPSERGIPKTPLGKMRLYRSNTYEMVLGDPPDAEPMIANAERTR
jgi:hypothetical protein